MDLKYCSRVDDLLHILLPESAYTSDAIERLLEEDVRQRAENQDLEASNGGSDGDFHKVFTQELSTMSRGRPLPLPEHVEHPRVPRMVATKHPESKGAAA